MSGAPKRLPDEPADADGSAGQEATHAPPPVLSRRALFGGVAWGGVALGGAALAGGAMIGRSSGDAAQSAPAVESTALDGWRPEPIPAHGAHQAGIARPSTPQPHLHLAALAFEAMPDRGVVAELLDGIGREIARWCAAAPGEDPLLPDGGVGIAISIGVGGRLVQLLGEDPATATMPMFKDDGELGEARGGDLAIAVHAYDPAIVRPLVSALRGRLPAHRVLWEQSAFRGAPALDGGTVARNPLGFLDGVIVPRGAEELGESVWIASGPFRGGAVMGVRRLRLDIDRWNGESVEEQERVMGRSKTSGAPLSGGDGMDEANILAKTPEGEWQIPARSHVRSAHPSFTGSQLMLRRSYMYDNGSGDAGLLFISFQHSIDVFAKTQTRLDENDDLMGYALPTASSGFVMLPGFTADRGLGAPFAAA